MAHEPNAKPLRIGQVSARYGISEYLIRRGLETGHFPEPVIVGARTRLWAPEELDAYFHTTPLATVRAQIASARLRQRGRKTPPTNGS